jgi:hypothetical protein
MSAMAPSAAPKGAPKLKAFAAGTREIRLPVGTAAFNAGQQVQIPNQGPIPKSGFLAALYFQFIGTITVGTIGSAGTPNLYSLIQTYLLTANYGYQYRNCDGETLYVMGALSNTPRGYMPATSRNTYVNYNPASATAQSVNMTWVDRIALNEGVNYQDFLISCQTLDSDLIMQITFPNVVGSGINANTEIISSITGTLNVDGLWFSVPDKTVFQLPNINYIQQITSGDSGLGTGTVANAVNTCNLTPVQGPRYMQLLCKVYSAAGNDPTSNATTIVQFELKANNAESLFIRRAQEVLNWQEDYFGMTNANNFNMQGWFIFDFLHDVTLPSAKGMFGRNIVSTQLYSTLWLNITTSASLAANTQFKIAKRIAAPIQA